MLQVPEKDFQRSISRSNIDVTSLGDWLEACLLFSSDRVSKNDVVKILIDEQICNDDGQDLAFEIATNGWNELERRSQWNGLSLGVDFTHNRLMRHSSWENNLFPSFLILLSLLRIYPDWAARHRDSIGQGNLFEHCIEILGPSLLPGWKTYRTGWTPDDAKNIPKIVESLCEVLFTVGAPDLEQWIPAHSNDGGLDLVCYRSFGDEREAMPVFFLQCASGKNWRDKIHTPKASVWQKYLNSAVAPSTGIVAPFVIDDIKLRQASLEGQIIVFDRLRILSAHQEHPVELPEDLNDSLRAWMEPRVSELPFA